MENTETVTKKQRPGKKARPTKAKLQQETPKTTAESHIKSVLGIELNANTARNAIILSEIIGPPVSRRRNGR